MTENLFNLPDPEINAREEILTKWKDKPLEEVLKAKVDSDLYIKTMERQKDELRNDYLKLREELLAEKANKVAHTKFEELLDRYEKTPKELPLTAPEVKEESKYDPKEIESMIENKIKQTKLNDIQTENFYKVQNKLKEKFGDNYASILKDQQNQLRLSDDDVNSLAKKSPEAFFRMLGLNDVKQNESFQTPPRTNQRNDNFAPKGPVKRNYAFYQEMKKTNPKAYLDPKIAVQMHNDVIEMGEDAFYN
jgi:hypothetical protein